MDDAVNQYAKELADAIAAAIADSSRVKSCRAKVREAGFDMLVTLEAVVGFVDLTTESSVTKMAPQARLLPAGRTFDLTANDRRFLRSLRIGAHEAKEAVE